MDRLPVHELSAVNGHSLRFKCRATAGAMISLSQGKRLIVGGSIARKLGDCALAIMSIATLQRPGPFSSEAERAHVRPDFFDVAEALCLWSRLSHIPPTSGNGSIGWPDRILLLVVHHDFVVVESSEFSIPSHIS